MKTSPDNERTNSESHHAAAAAHHVSAAHHNQRAMQYLALGAIDDARSEAEIAYQYSELAHYQTATARELDARAARTSSRTIRIDGLAKRSG